MTSNSDPDLYLVRTFDAPRALVCQAWTDPVHLAAWWGPHGFTNPVCRIDPHVGGEIHIEMRGPDGTVYPMSGKLRVVDLPVRLVFISAIPDPAGRPIFEVLTEVAFAITGERTTQTLTVRVISQTAQAARYVAGMARGWEETLDRLAAHVADMARPGPSPVVSLPAAPARR